MPCCTDGITNAVIPNAVIVPDNRRKVNVKYKVTRQSGYGPGEQVERCALHTTFERISLDRMLSQMKSRVSPKSPTVLDLTRLKLPTVHTPVTMLIPPTMPTPQTLIY